MSFERFTVKKIYYYVVCAVTLFVLMWGAVDVVSSILSATVLKPPSVSLDASSGEQGGAMAGPGGKNMAAPSFDEFYQGQMTMDRMVDSLARLLIAGGLFLYASSKVREIESKEI